MASPAWPRTRDAPWLPQQRASPTRNTASQPATPLARRCSPRRDTSAPTAHLRSVPRRFRARLAGSASPYRASHRPWRPRPCSRCEHPPLTTEPPPSATNHPPLHPRLPPSSPVVDAGRRPTRHARAASIMNSEAVHHVGSITTLGWRPSRAPGRGRSGHLLAISYRARDCRPRCLPQQHVRAGRVMSTTTQPGALLQRPLTARATRRRCRRAATPRL